MKTYTSADRRAWIQHYQESGNISETCRHFGITRSTLYRWLSRYDPTHPSKPLRSRPTRRKTNPTPKWTNDDLKVLAEMDCQTRARLGAGRLSQRLQQRYGMPWSRATVGRMLSKVRKRCPICGVQNKHNLVRHSLARDRSREEREAQFDAGHP
jgi:transposase-like protein